LPIATSADAAMKATSKREADIPCSNRAAIGSGELGSRLKRTRSS
jgi:hypothetical protein